jgi:hypothetical protein
MICVMRIPGETEEKASTNSYAMSSVGTRLHGPDFSEESREAKPIAMISPIISFVGLLIIYNMRKLSTLAGCPVYIVITGIWLSLTLPILNPEVSGSLTALSTFAGQFIPVMVGYFGYLLARRTTTSSTQASPQQVHTLESETNTNANPGHADR